jgi:hypothetical protein
MHLHSQWGHIPIICENIISEFALSSPTLPVTLAEQCRALPTVSSSWSLADWELLPAACCSPASWERILLYIASLEKDENSKHVVWFILNTYCFYTIVKLKSHKSSHVKYTAVTAQVGWFWASPKLGPTQRKQVKALLRTNLSSSGVCRSLLLASFHHFWFTVFVLSCYLWWSILVGKTHK